MRTNDALFAGAGRQAMYSDVDVKFGGETLQLALPQTHTGAIAAATVAGDLQALGVWILLAAHLMPPAPHRLHREGGGVMVHRRWPNRPVRLTGTAAKR
jgi:hypothetical protein